MTRLSVGVREAAEMTGIPEGQVRRAVMRLELPAVRLSQRGRIVIKVADLEAWIDGLERVR